MGPTGGSGIAQVRFHDFTASTGGGPVPADDTMIGSSGTKTFTPPFPFTGGGTAGETGKFFIEITPSGDPDNNIYIQGNVEWGAP